MGVLCTWVKLLTDLQILGAVNCTKMRLAAGPAGGAIACSQTPYPKGEGNEGRGKKGLGMGRGR